MEIVTERAQERYWRRTRYLAGDHPVAKAFALPKIEYISQYVDLSSARILDVGCGKGVFTNLFAARSSFVVGLDYSTFMLGSNPGRRLLQGRAEELPFRAEVFDVAFVSNLLHHVANPYAVIRELARVSRRYVVAVEPNRLNPVMFLFSLLVKEEQGGLRFSQRYLARLLAESDLRVVRCRAMGMISQNNTPRILVRLLRGFDREIFWGEYLVAIAEKRRSGRT